MNRPVQKRTLKTRARLVDTAVALVAEHGYQALRVDDVVAGAGVAKGTFFAHFPDKDALMDLLVGAEINQHLDAIETQPPPEDIDAILAAMMPLLHFMTTDRYVFDVILRHSGAALADDIGVIATTFMRNGQVLGAWLSNGPFRRDVPPDMLAEGVLAFATQAMALHFCALHNVVPLDQRLRPYLQAWLLPEPPA
ncbi:MAG: TetR/AcrR family transcriptional regulator [Sulfitobacter sp.]